MQSNSTIQNNLILAYNETDFIVDLDPQLTMHIAEYNEELLNLYKLYNVNSCAFITAYNPYSEITSDSQNVQRNQVLFNELKSKELFFLNGEGKHPSGNWPGEASYLILGISVDESKELGSKYEQNAIIWCGQDVIPQLVLLR